MKDARGMAAADGPRCCGTSRWSSNAAAVNRIAEQAEERKRSGGDAGKGCGRALPGKEAEATEPQFSRDFSYRKGEIRQLLWKKLHTGIPCPRETWHTHLWGKRGTALLGSGDSQELAGVRRGWKRRQGAGVLSGAGGPAHEVLEAGTAAVVQAGKLCTISRRTFLFAKDLFKRNRNRATQAHSAGGKPKHPVPSAPSTSCDENHLDVKVLLTKLFPAARMHRCMPPFLPKFKGLWETCSDCRSQRRRLAGCFGCFGSVAWDGATLGSQDGEDAAGPRE
ncbi:uncharacterized protein LJ206_014444 [Theristicus caerulescens]